MEEYDDLSRQQNLFPVNIADDFRATTSGHLSAFVVKQPEVKDANIIRVCTSEMVVTHHPRNFRFDRWRAEDTVGRIKYRHKLIIDSEAWPADINI